MQPFQRPDIIAYSALLAQSFRRWTGQPIVTPAPENSPEAFAEALFRAPFALVSHGTEPDPIFRYANQTALELWEMDWESFTRLPSRQSAQAVDDIQNERQQLLAKALQQGWADDYSGIRISRSGRRFAIQNTTLWNVTNTAGTRHGQAALIRSWKYI